MGTLTSDGEVGWIGVRTTSAPKSLQALAYGKTNTKKSRILSKRGRKKGGVKKNFTAPFEQQSQIKCLQDHLKVLTMPSECLKWIPVINEDNGDVNLDMINM